MSNVVKVYDVTIKNKTSDGGEIVISTSSVDRDGDRIFPLGGGQNNGKGLITETYMQNPIVLVSHRYDSPEYIAGRTEKLDVTRDTVAAKFKLRPAASPTDLQNVTRLAWEGDWMRMASIGFRPHSDHMFKNDFGGADIYELELYEWSLVAIGSNRDALSRAAARQSMKRLSNVAPLANAIQTLRTYTGEGYVTKSESAQWDTILDQMTEALPLYARYPDVSGKLAKLMNDLAQDYARY